MEEFKFKIVMEFNKSSWNLDIENKKSNLNFLHIAKSPCEIIEIHNEENFSQKIY